MHAFRAKKTSFQQRKTSFLHRKNAFLHKKNSLFHRKHSLFRRLTGPPDRALWTTPVANARGAGRLSLRPGTKRADATSRSNPTREAYPTTARAARDPRVAPKCGVVLTFFEIKRTLFQSKPASRAIMSTF